MHVVVHQAVAPDPDPTLAPVPGQSPEVESPVVIIKEHLAAVVAALGDVVRESNGDCSRYPRHNRSIQPIGCGVKKYGKCPGSRIRIPDPAG